MPGPGPGPKRFRLSDSGSLGCKYLKVCIVWGKDSVGERGSCGLGSRQREKKNTQIGSKMRSTTSTLAQNPGVPVRQ